MRIRLPAALLVAALAANRARAAVPTYVVNSTDETHDAIPGDGKCETSPGNGLCTLRAAVEEANTNSTQFAALITIPALTISLAIGDLPVSKSMTISGAGMRQTVIRAASGNRIFTLAVASISLALEHLTLRDGNTSFNGGAVSTTTFDGNTNISLNHVLVTNCSAGDGGAVWTTGPVAVLSSVITHCHASNAGGALYMRGTASGTAVGDLASSTLDTNTSVSGGGAIVFETTFGPVYLLNCTVSGNQAGGGGGGIFVGGVGAGTLTLDHVTITDNTSTASHGGGGIYNESAASAVSLSHALLADNLDASGLLLADGDCAGAITSTAPGCNILGPLGHGHCAVTGSFTAAEPLFGPLQDNGGPTPTRALLAGSPAVNFTCGVSEATQTDQRGVQHLGAFADLGAYERAPCGDVNGDGVVDVADVFFLINFLFAGGPLPPGLANVNQDSVRDVLDVFYLINDLFAGGPAPVCPGT
jgi:hypothetical protein